jgi:hypothetical protein
LIDSFYLDRAGFEDGGEVLLEVWYSLDYFTDADFVLDGFFVSLHFSYIVGFSGAAVTVDSGAEYTAVGSLRD